MKLHNTKPLQKPVRLCSSLMYLHISANICGLNFINKVLRWCGIEYGIPWYWTVGKRFYATRISSASTKEILFCTSCEMSLRLNLIWDKNTMFSKIMTRTHVSRTAYKPKQREQCIPIHERFWSFSMIQNSRTHKLANQFEKSDESFTEWTYGIQSELTYTLCIHNILFYKKYSQDIIFSNEVVCT